MKNFLSVLFSIMIASTLMNPIQTFANEETAFDEFGVRKNINLTNLSTLQDSNERTLASAGWSTFPSKKDVPLNKEWSINFSSIATYDKIDAIVIERNSQYIPVMISFNDSKEVKVRPADQFSGNSTYTLKILLANGKKYKMDFTTVPESRNADVETNDSYIHSPEVYLNETIKGEITKDDIDFFKIEVPTFGTLDVSLTGYNRKGMTLHLYGSNGNNKGAMASKINFTQGSISEGLMPGTYYVKVGTYYSSDDSPYELQVNFNPSTIDDDSGTYNYLESSQIDLNTSLTGHVGYFNDYQYGNYVDFFKIEVPSSGTLDVNLTGYNRKGMTLHLYGSNGDNKSAMDSKINFTQGGISEGLMPGTYYIKVSTYYESDYSPYKLDVNFTQSTFEDDNGTYNYLDSNVIGLKTSFTGHVGYFNDYRYGNYVDFFKIEVPRSGTLDINLTGYNRKGMTLHLYGSEGDNKSAIASKINFTQGGISKDLAPGTYYVRVSTYYESDYSPYELEVGFVEN